MKDKFLKMAGVKSEKEFYKKYPTEEAFFKANPSALKMMQTGGGLQDQQIFQYPNYDQNMMAYMQKAQEDQENKPMSAITNMFKTGAMALGQAADNNPGKAMDAMNAIGSFMQMGGSGIMMRDNQYDEGGEMALGQIMAMHDKLSSLQKFVNTDSEIEPWVASKITLADDYLNSVSEYMQYNEGNEGPEEEEDTDMNMGEIEQMKMGGIPQRYKSRGFTKVGAKRKSDRAGKKWMVLAKKGDKYKIVHGGYVGMKDFSQHGSEKRKDNFWNRMGGKNSAKATDPFSPLYWHKRFGTWAYGGDISDAPINTSMSPGIGTDPRFEQYYNQQLQNLNSAGVRDVKSMPSRDDIYSYYQSSIPQSVTDQTGRMMFSNPKGTISTGTTFSQSVDPNTGQVLNQGTNLQKSAFDQQARRFYSGGQPVQKADPMQPIIDAEKKAKRRDALKTAGIAAGAIGTAIFDSVRQYQEDLGFSKWQNENKNYEASDVPSNKELRKIGRRANGGEPTNAGFQALPDYVQNKIISNMAEGGEMIRRADGSYSRRGLWDNIRAAAGSGKKPTKEMLEQERKIKAKSMAYGGDIDMYGGQMDMDAMYQMMKGGGSTNSGDAWYQQGGQGEDQVMQAIQMYAQMTQTDPEQILSQLKAMPPQEQQQAIQQIMQAIQQQQSQSPDSMMAYGGIHINPANKGKFTASANRAGMSVQEFASKVLANKEDYSSTQVKRANFARNAAGWNKQMGGMTQGSELELHPDEIQNLIDQGYGIEYLD
jgi:hypothetical protein